MSFADIFSVQLQILASGTMVKTHGILPSASQLIVESAENSKYSREAYHEALAALLRKIVGHCSHFGLITIGSFCSSLSWHTSSNLAPLTEIWGESLYLVPATDALDALFAIDAESVCIVAGNKETISRFASRVNGMEAQWWKSADMTLTGALTHVFDIVDPIVLYSRTHDSFELFGTESSIGYCYNMIREMR